MLSDILGTDVDVIYRDIEDEVDRQLLNTAISKLNRRERDIIELRFGLKNNGIEKTQKEVADMMGISQSYISQFGKKDNIQIKKGNNEICIKYQM